MVCGGESQQAAAPASAAPLQGLTASSPLKPLLQSSDNKEKERKLVGG
jgi:hypothetical protein